MSTILLSASCSYCARTNRRSKPHSSPMPKTRCVMTDLLLQSVGVDRCPRACLQELVAKAENLKTAAITDDPKIQLPLAVGGWNLDEARQPSLLFDGAIDAGRPATRTR